MKRFFSFLVVVCVLMSCVFSATAVAEEDYRPEVWVSLDEANRLVLAKFDVQMYIERGTIDDQPIVEIGWAERAVFLFKEDGNVIWVMGPEEVPVAYVKWEAVQSAVKALLSFH